MQTFLVIKPVLFIDPSLSMPAFTMPRAKVGQAYSFQFPTPTGGIGPFTYQSASIDANGNIVPVALPAGLSVSTSGLLAGTPTTPAGSAGATLSIVIADTGS